MRQVLKVILEALVLKVILEPQEPQVQQARKVIRETPGLKETQVLEVMKKQDGNYQLMK